MTFGLLMFFQLSYKNTTDKTKNLRKKFNCTNWLSAENTFLMRHNPTFKTIENHTSKILWLRLEHVWPLQTWAGEEGWELHARTAIDVGLRNCSCDVFNMCTFPEILNGAGVWPGLVWCGIRMAWPMALQMKLPHNECWPTLIIPLVFTATLATLALNKWKCLTGDWSGHW